MNIESQLAWGKTKSTCSEPLIFTDTVDFSTFTPVFLDADGVLWEDNGPGSIFNTGTSKSFMSNILLIKEKVPNSLVVIISNQTCIARGICDEHTLRKKITEMCTPTKATLPPIIFSYCPHHPNADVSAYRQDCWCRKPSFGQFDKLKNILDLNMRNAFMIGDRITDLEAAEKAGIKQKYLIASKKSFEINESDGPDAWSSSIVFQVNKDIKSILLSRV